jgi:hypothetical protein
MENKETLEEAAKRYSYGGREGGHRIPFLEGVKWQQERSYSEEEVLEILVKAMKEVKAKQLTFFDGGSEYPIYSNLSKWFNEFKNK